MAKQIKVINPIKFEYDGTIYDNVDELKSSEHDKIKQIIINNLHDALLKHRAAQSLGYLFSIPSSYIYSDRAELDFYKNYITDHPNQIRVWLDEVDKETEELNNAIQILEYSNRKEKASE